MIRLGVHVHVRTLFVSEEREGGWGGGEREREREREREEKGREKIGCVVLPTLVQWISFFFLRKTLNSC